MNISSIVRAVGLASAALALPALAQPVVDGQRDAIYGSPLAVQTNPTFFGDSGNSDCDSQDLGNPGDVVTGIEIAIPLLELGSPSGTIRIFAAVNGQGHDFVSNQVLGGLDNGTPNLGEPRTLDFNVFPGDQFVEFDLTTGAAPVIDGVLDASYVELGLQTNQTGFGDNDDGSVDFANGSELDGAYAVVNDGVLYLFLTGNLQSNFNKLEVFFDTEAGGQNKLRGDNPDVDFDGLNRMGDDGSDNGMTFDAGFTADYYLTLTNGNDPVTIFANFASLNGGYGDYIGSTTPGSDGTLNGGTNPYGIALTLDNSNVEGVPGRCPPAGTRDFANGSELNALYAHLDVPGNRLYLLFTGNLQNGEGGKDSNSGNKLNVFIDAQPGGQNKLRGDNVDISFGNLNRMGDDGSGNGLTFDTGFEPDYWMSLKTNNFPVYQALDSAVLRTDGRKTDFSGFPLDYGAFDGNFKSEETPVPYAGPRVDIQDGSFNDLFTNYGPRLTEMDPFNPIPGLLGAYIDNSNVDGVSDSGTDGAADVTTGMELVIDLDELGWDGVSEIKVLGFISNEDAGYLSNQFLPGLPAGTGNLGDQGPTNSIDLNSFAGDQFAVIGGDDPCDYADFNGDGTVNTQDVLAFLNAWSNGNSSADCNDDGSVNTQDVLCFLNTWNGCR